MGDTLFQGSNVRLEERRGVAVVNKSEVCLEEEKRPLLKAQ